MSMWEPFTERARRCIVLAQEEARRLGNNYMGTEHILLGLISERESFAAKILESHHINLAKVRQEVEAIVGRGGLVIQQEMIFTQRAKKVINLAFEIARERNHNYIGTEHLLEGLLKENEGVAARVLTNLGVNPQKMIASIDEMPLREQKTTETMKKELVAAAAIHTGLAYGNAKDTIRDLINEAFLAGVEWYKKNAHHR